MPPGENLRIPWLLSFRKLIELGISPVFLAGAIELKAFLLKSMFAANHLDWNLSLGPNVDIAVGGLSLNGYLHGFTAESLRNCLLMLILIHTVYHV